MSEEQSRAGAYLRQASTMRALASETRFPEVRARLLLMAASCDRLADQVEKWENKPLVRATD
jgi:hypothetical protein